MLVEGHNQRKAWITFFSCFPVYQLTDFFFFFEKGVVFSQLICQNHINIKICGCSSKATSDFFLESYTKTFYQQSVMHFRSCCHALYDFEKFFYSFHILTNVKIDKVQLCFLEWFPFRCVFSGKQRTQQILKIVHFKVIFFVSLYFTKRKP